MPDATDRDARGGDVFVEVDAAIHALQRHADPDVRAAAQTLLAGVDAVHRAGLTHLVDALRGIAGDTLINRLIADPAIRILLMSYDLIAVDRRLQAEEALDTVRGHLHDHGIDVEILEVVGGVVYVRLHHSAAGAALPLDRVRQDLEAALRELFLGFQELVFRARGHEPPPVMVSLDTLRRANRPLYRDAVAAGEVMEGQLHGVQVDGVDVVLVRLGDEIHGLRNQCGDSPLPLEHGTLEGTTLVCPWHGCRYDVRTGRRLDADGRAAVVPVRVESGRVQVAVGVQRGEP